MTLITYLSNMEEKNKEQTANSIKWECELIREMLLSKNSAYGDSAMQRGILFDIDPVTAIQARINDKLNRIKNKGVTDETEDTIGDLIGYLILLKIAMKR